MLVFLPELGLHTIQETFNQKITPMPGVDNTVEQIRSNSIADKGKTYEAVAKKSYSENAFIHFAE